MRGAPSVCHMSVCRPRSVTHTVELLGNIFAPSNSPGTRTFSIKILKKFEGILGIVQVKYKDCYGKLAFFD